MDVLSILVALCAFAAVVGAIEVRQTFGPHWEVRAGLFALLMVVSIIVMTSVVEWTLFIRIGAAVVIALAYIGGIILGHPPTLKRAKPAPKTKVDYPLSGDDFRLSGYEDRAGNPTHSV